MIQDISAMMWKEWREALRALGGKKGWMGLVIVVVVFGFVMPYQMGRMWVESPVIIGIFAWLSLVPVMMVVADSFAGERERHTLETLLASRLSNRAILLGKAAVTVGYGWGTTMVFLVLGLIGVNIGHADGQILLYKPIIAWGTPLLSLLTASLGTGVGILISLRASTVKQAHQTLSLLVMLLWFGPFFGAQLLPKAWRAEVIETVKNANFQIHNVILAIAAILLVVDVLLLAAAMLRCQRAKLILD